MVSHRSGQVGRKGRGRIFRAGLDANCNNNVAKVPSSIQTGLRDAEITFLEAISGDYGVTDHTYTRTAVIGAPWTKYGLITSVRVGDRMDTQRRRRSQLDETYVTGNVTY